MTKFSKILVANRGEIACRILRTAFELDYKTVAIYSVADKDAPHVVMADEAICVGGPDVGSSYLNIDKIINAAKECGADAIHPGYGFLSENAEFARACDQAGIIFIGPSIQAIELMGNKAEAKRRMLAANVPCVPGYDGEDQSDAALIAQAQMIGFPLMVKATAGGGGRGMRLVDKVEALPDALVSARSEAMSAFGSDEVILEKAILTPRHVEFQVFGDSRGNVIHLGERDCSVQRRHQKIIEEAPCPVMTDELRDKMGATAIKAAKDINYVGAGTVEFLLDDNGAFYFLEMNTRLQVEHPVTEEITGLDLVALQFQVAQGMPLGLTQSDVNFIGHAIEVRLYAEDTANGFLPATGCVNVWAEPMDDGIRVDSGIDERFNVSPFYDPMLAKIIAHGPDRQTARDILVEALRHTVLIGVPTNRLFLIDALQQQRFADGAATTAFMGDHYPDDHFVPPRATAVHNAVAAVIKHHVDKHAIADLTLSPAGELAEWSSSGTISRVNKFAAQNNLEAAQMVHLACVGDDRYAVTIADASFTVMIDGFGADWVQLKIDGAQFVCSYFYDGASRISLSGDDFSVTLIDLTKQVGGSTHAAGDGAVLAPMHGRIINLAVAQGDNVIKGDIIGTLEAMKMEHQVEAPISGKVEELCCVIGDQKGANELIAVIVAP